MTFSIALSACSPLPYEPPQAIDSLGEASSVYAKLTPSDFASKLSELNDEQLIDVRTPTEYRIGHLEGATMFDFRAPEFREQVDRLDRSRPVMIYCAAGGRSSAVVAVLHELGFTEIYELQGGLTSWIGEERTTVK